MLKKFRRPRALFEADGGGGAGWDGGAGSGGAGTGTESPEALKLELEKQKTETARLWKLLNDKAEADKAREAEEAKKQEEEAKKRGEFEKLYWEQKTQYDELTGKHATTNETLTRYEEHFKTQYEESLKALSKEQKDTIEKLLEWKSNFDKATLVPSLLAQFWGKAFGKDPSGKTQDPTKTDNVQELLKNWDFIGAMASRLSK